ncbi:MFS general substrate transporter [Artomyces pyxidatus]|uniref:MFS general substrate transporter n=1 Tax=Artomyces pyxidatus TaxID=48021 RepID=A0ACB8SSF4_9AGAM|nr:MFS general substrate transporter [Artomyces pyxidatus]
MEKASLTDLEQQDSSTKHTSANEDNEQSHPVDGGTRAWLTLFGAWLSVAATFGYTNAFGVYQDLYTREHDISASRASWIGATQMFVLIATGVPAGKLYDMGYFRRIFVVGAVIYIFSLFMVSLAHPDKYYQVFLSQGIGMGIGGGLIYTPALAIQSQHWRTHRSLAMGVASTGVAVGGIFFPIMLNRLVHGSAGFAWGVRASAFVVMGMLGTAGCIMTSYPRRVAKDSEPAPDAIFKDAPYMVFIIGGIFVNWGIFLPYFYLQLYGIVHGIDPKFAFYMLAIMNGSSIPGRVVPNLLSGKLGPINILASASFGCAILTFALLSVKFSIAGIVIFAVLYGFCAGTLFSMVSPAVAAYCDERQLGARLGLALAMGSVGILTGAPIEGELLGANYTWSRPIFFSAVRSRALTT